MQSGLQKLVQKRLYDVLSHRYGVLFVATGLFMCCFSVFMFGEAVMEWSSEKYAAVFNSYSDNLAGKSFQSSLCLPVPIDVVYTWVNGTDPKLLMDLKRYKFELETELNISRSVSSADKSQDKCTFSQCVQMKSVVLDPILPAEISLNVLKQISPIFRDAVQMFVVTSPIIDKLNYTVVTFDTEEHVLKAVNRTVQVHGKNHTVHKAYITSDWTVQHSILLHDIIIMSGFPHKYTVDQLMEKLPEKHRKQVAKIDLHEDRGIAVLFVPNRKDFDALLELTNLTIEGKQPTLNAANLVWDLSESIDGDVATASRYEDNEELRYSIRSLERFAPWVRHIYIVTNGQIPSWLNLDHPRVTIVTHDEIFLNKSHLPNFGSPAIESHIHRIAGLSDKFIYLNDDVMFGKEVWPDDFYTHSRGQKVYLSWPVPNCQEGCPSNWIRDGYCDKACNNSDCDWDGGDCSGANAASGHGQQGGGFYFNNQDTSKLYCASGCANNWIADKYCDQSCNVKTCGFDAADCGTDNFDQLYSLGFQNDVKDYKLPPGINLAFFNLSSVLVDEAILTSASYNTSDVIRSIAVALKFKVMTLVLMENHNKTVLRFNLKGHTGEESNKFEYNFTLAVNTRHITQEKNTTVSRNITSTSVKGSNISATNLTSHNGSAGANLAVVEPPFRFEEIPEALRKPKVPSVKLKIDKQREMTVDFSSLQLSSELQTRWHDLEQQFTDGDLTEKGFNLHKWLLWQDIKSYKKQHGDLKSFLQKKIPLRKDVNTNLSNSNLQNQSYVKSVGRKRHLLSVFPVEQEGEMNSIQILSVDTQLYTSASHNNTLQSKGVNPGKGGNSDIVIPYENLFKPGGFKWERSGVFMELLKMKDKISKENRYSVDGFQGRQLNQFADSLRHVNKLFNKEFGYTARKVPSHMPHMVDKHVMAELQTRFPVEWDATSGHRVRSSADMQFAFSYFYYLMGVTKNTTVEEIFDMMDTDHSRALSDREIRTLATRLYDLPLDLKTLTDLENLFVNCSEHLPVELKREIPEPPMETYYVSDMPQVTRNLFINCDQVVELLHKNFKPRSKYKFDIISDESEVTFKMIKTNVSSVVGQLDDIRKHPKKFICLNDNIEHEREEAKTVKAVLVDFYESMFPVPSQLELPREYRNRFLHIDELRDWKRYRDWLRFWTNLALVLLVIFAIMSFFGDKIDAVQRRFGHRRQPQSTDTPPGGEEAPSESGRGGVMEV